MPRGDRPRRSLLNRRHGEHPVHAPDTTGPREQDRVMSMSEPFQPNTPRPADDARPDDDLSLDDDLAGTDPSADDLDTDGAPAGDLAPDEDLADLPENPVFRTPEPGDRLHPDDLAD